MIIWVFDILRVSTPLRLKCFRNVSPMFPRKFHFKCFDWNVSEMSLPCFNETFKQLWVAWAMFQKRSLRNFWKTDISTFLPQFANVSDTCTETFQSFKIHVVETFQTHFVLCGKSTLTLVKKATWLTTCLVTCPNRC